MSQENVEIVRRGYDAFNRRDLDALLATLDPEVEFSVSDVFLDRPSTYHGHAEWRDGFLSDLATIFDEFRIQPERVVDAGDRVAAVVQAGGTGRASGATAMSRVGHVFTLRAGRVVRFVEYRTPTEALEAVGLRE